MPPKTENFPSFWLLMLGVVPVVVWTQKVSPAINTKSTTIIQSPTLKIQPFAAPTSFDPKIADMKLYDFSMEANKRKPQYNKRYTEMDKPYYTKTYEGKAPEKVSYEIKVYIPKHIDIPPAYPAPDEGINKSAYAPQYELPVPATDAYPPYNYEPAYPVPPPPKYDSKSPYVKPYYPHDEKVMYDPKPYYPNYYEAKPVVYEKPPVYDKPVSYNYEKPVVYDKKPPKTYAPDYDPKYNEVPYHEAPYPKISYPEPPYSPGYDQKPRHPDYGTYEPKYEVKPQYPPKYVEPSYAPVYEYKPVKYEPNGYEPKPNKPEIPYPPATTYEPKQKEPNYIPYQKPAYPEKAHYDKVKQVNYDHNKGQPYEPPYYPAPTPPVYYQPTYQPMYYYYYPKPYEMPSPPPYYPPAASTYQYYTPAVPPTTTHSYGAYSNY